MDAIDTWQDTTSILECLKTKGVRAIGRYYSKSDWKRLGSAEARAISEAGLEIFVVYQDSNNKYEKFSAERGMFAGKAALKYATEEISQPSGSAIYFAVDYDASPKETKARISDYFRAVRKELQGSGYDMGVYGNGAVCEHLLDTGLVEYTWLSMSKGHYGHKDFYGSKRWSLCQKLDEEVCGIDVDPDEINGGGAIGSFRVSTTGADAVTSVEPEVQAISDGIGFVKTEGLNLRDAPDGNVITSLTIGDRLEILGAASEANWKRVRTGGHEGYVFGKYVRLPSSDTVERLLANVIAQWVRFEKGTAKETTSPYDSYIGEMWQRLGESYTGDDNVPWSAAFVSYVVGQSGAAYSNFKFAASHSVFVNDAIQSRILGRTDRPFWGYRPSEAKPALGDIIARNRDGNDYSFDYAENHEYYLSHSDIVVEVTDRVVRVMGGNVRDTVSTSTPHAPFDIQEYELATDGQLRSGQGLIALLKNRAADV